LIFISRKREKQVIPVVGDYQINNNPDEVRSPEKTVISWRRMEGTEEAIKKLEYEFTHSFWANGEWVEIGKSKIKLELLHENESSPSFAYCRPSYGPGEVWARMGMFDLDTFFERFWWYTGIPSGKDVKDTKP
jgi:hypothetical protein